MKENSTLREEGRLRQFPKKRENKKERLLFLKKHRFQSFPSRLAWNTSTVFTMYEDRARIKSRRRQSRINISFLIETGLTRGSITQAFVFKLCSSIHLSPAKPILDKKKRRNPVLDFFPRNIYS